MNDDDIQWLHWIARTLYAKENRERMARLVTTLTADLGRAREENERLAEACRDVESKIVDYEAGRINWRPDDFLMRVRRALASLRPAAKDGGDANVL